MRYLLVLLFLAICCFYGPIALSQIPIIKYSAPVDLAQSDFTFDGSPFSVASQQTIPEGIAFSLNGQKMFVIGGQLAAFAKISEYNLTTSFDLSSGASYSGNSFSLFSYEGHPTSLYFDLYGSKMFVGGLSASNIHQFSLPFAFDFSSGVIYDGTPGGNSYEDFVISNSGLKILVLGQDDIVRQFSLVFPYDVVTPTLTNDGSPVDLTGQESNARSFAFNNNGTKMFVIGDGQAVYQYSLSTPFDITGGISYDGVTFDISEEESNPTGLAFNNTDTRMFVLGKESAEVNQYSIDSDVFKETSANDGSVQGALITTLIGHTFSNAGGTLTSPTHFTINNLPAGLTPSMAVDATGTYTTMTLSGNATEWDDVSDLNFTFTNAAFTSTAAAGIYNAVAANSKLGINFNERKLSYASEIDITNVNNVKHDARTFDAAAHINIPVGMAFNEDGTKLFITGLDAKVDQYHLLYPFTITSGVIYDNNPLDISSELTFPQDIAFNSDGTKMFVLGSIEHELNQYSLHIPYDLTSGVSFDGSPFNISEDFTPVGMAFNTEGSRLFIVGSTNKKVYQYSLSTAFETTSGVTYDGSPLDLSIQNLSPRGIAFNAGGTRMFIASEGDDEINQYSLANPFDITSGVSFDGNPLIVSADEPNPTDIEFSRDGNRMFLLGNGDKEINQYNLLGGFREDISNVGAVNGSAIIPLAGSSFVNSGGTLTYATHYSIANLPPGLSSTLSVSGDGHVATLSFTGTATVHDNAEDVASLTFTFEDAAFSGGGASYIQNAVDGSSGFSVDFIDAPSIDYYPSMDITVPGSITYSGNHFDLTAQETTPYDLTFNTDGTKMYVVGNENKEINQFSLSTPFDIISGVTFDGSPLDLSAGGFIPVSLAFNSDGSRLIVIGNSGQLKQFSLSTPFDITSGVSFQGDGYNTQPDISNSFGLVFSSDGTKMFVNSQGIKSIAQYRLSASFNILSGVTLEPDLLDVSGEMSYCSDIAFSPDGKKLFVASNLDKKIYQYSLSEPFEITSGVTFDGLAYTLPSGAMVPNGISLGEEGKKLFITGPDVGFMPTIREVNQYSISTSGYSESSLNDGNVDGKLSVIVSGETFTNQGGTLTTPTDFSVTPVPTGLTPALSVSPDGHSGELTFTGNAVDHENVDDVADLSFTFQNSAFSGGDASAIANSSSASSGQGIDFQDNNAPVFTSATATSYDENGTGTVIDVNANDGEGGAEDSGITYSLTGGTDQSDFIIDVNSGTITFSSPPNFEIPDDDNTDNDYEIEVTADDGGAANNTTIQMIAITVDDVNEDPVFTSSNTVGFIENGTGTVLDVDANDGDEGASDAGITYSLSGGTDNTKFNINASDGLITFNSSPDFENPLDADTDNDYELVVTANDGVKISDQTITVSVSNFDEDPVFTSSPAVDYSENGTGTVIDINANNGDGGAADTGITYSISGGSDMASFGIDASSGLLTFNSPPDFENPSDGNTDNDYELTVTASDGVESTDQMITITVSNIDEDPVFSSTSSADFAENGTGVVLDVDANDGDGGSTDTGITYSIIGDDMTRFSIATNGQLTFLTPPDFENPIDANQDNVYEIGIDASDGVNISSQALTITVLDEADNISPTISDQNFFINENLPNGSIVETVFAQDLDNDLLSFSITSGNTSDAFVIAISTGTISILNSFALDFETTPAFNLTIEVNDGNGGVASATVTIHLNNVNEPPSILDQSFVLDENSPFGTIVGTVEADDEDGDALSFSISSGNLNGAFFININTGELTVNNAQLMNFETNPSFVLSVQVLDGHGQSNTGSVTINLIDIDESLNAAPVIADQTFTIDENSAFGTLVGMVNATDSDGDPLFYSITNGNTNNAFGINSGSGELTVSSSSALDFETTPTFVLTIEVIDGNGGNASATITINLNDIDESSNNAPTISDQSFTIDESAAEDTSVGTVVATDPDGDALLYSIISGNDLGAFQINAATGELTITSSAPLDFDTNPVFSLEIEVIDGKGGIASAIITINLNDTLENTLPVIEDQIFSIAENSPDNTSVATIIAVDADGDVLVYSITTGNTGNAFAINSSSGELSVNNSSALDFETIPSFILTVEVNDGNGGIASATITINLNDVDEALGIGEDIQDVKIYPNPGFDELHIDDLNHLGNNVQLLVTDLFGKKLLEFKFKSSQNSFVIDISTLKSGIYLLIFQTEGSIFQRKITKTGY